MLPRFLNSKTTARNSYTRVSFTFRLLVIPTLLSFLGGCVNVPLFGFGASFENSPTAAEIRENKLWERYYNGDVSASYELGELYLNRGQILEGWKLVCIAAHHGVPPGQNALAYFYEGRNAIRWPANKPSPVKRNPILAHMWYSLAASNGYKGAISFRNWLTERLTPEQVDEAETLAKKWKPNPGDCRTP